MGGKATRLAASIGVSLVLHALVIANVSLLRPGGATETRPPRLIVSLPDAAPAKVRVADERAAAPAAPVPDATSADRGGDGHVVPHAEAPAPVVLPALEPHFFTLAELDTPPTVLQDIGTDPPELRHYPQGGKLVMRLWIDDAGKVVRAEATKSDLPEPFTQSARESFMRATFVPARKNGVAVGARVSVGIVYQPR